MPYYTDFLEAKDYSGQRIRGDNGDHVRPCLHNWVGHPIFENKVEFVADCIQEDCNRLSYINLVCDSCGEVHSLHRDNIFSDEDKFNEHLKKCAKEACE